MTKLLLGDLEVNRIYQRDCIEGMKMVPDKSVDMILCDLPYGVTRNKWDSVIPFAILWEQYERIIKDNGAIVLTAQDKFTAKLMLSNEKLHRYNLIWHKSRPTGFLNANRMPLRDHEDICVFYKKLPLYNPQFTEGKPNHIKEDVIPAEGANNNYGKFNPIARKKTSKKHPRSVIKVDAEDPTKLIHPTQKPVALFEYLIRTFTNEGEIVLDNCIGSGTTAVACINTKRQFIGFEKEQKYVELANMRLDSLQEATE
ncbi:DNA-methyltransferase [Niallia circulans]|uniref:DNA-methyltransferase n=1 Tax=Niallia circulans TaxID=1397 RepID=UPI00155FE52A|nr:site-specific DNA-methyltransferase [Niallia circulans]NRG33923.1 site-specific DNA-methyltransferase [Niallia circulans]